MYIYIYYVYLYHLYLKDTVVGIYPSQSKGLLRSAVLTIIFAALRICRIAPQTGLI